MSVPQKTVTYCNLFCDTSRFLLIMVNPVPEIIQKIVNDNHDERRNHPNP